MQFYRKYRSRKFFFYECEPFTDSAIGDYSSWVDFINQYSNIGAYDPWEPFIDSNNGQYDPWEWYEDGNGIWDDAESFTDSNENEEYDDAIIGVDDEEN